MKISGIYKITNIETNDCYVGSSKDIKQRWAQHKCFSTWNRHSNNKLYIAFQQYGLDKFSFEILEETDSLREREQYYIDLLKPVYNANRAKDLDIEKWKEYQKEYRQSMKGKEYQLEYHRTEKWKEYQKEYYNQLCFYKSETLTLKALTSRFYRAGIEHPTLEAKKYLINYTEA